MSPAASRSVCTHPGTVAGTRAPATSTGTTAVPPAAVTVQPSCNGFIVGYSTRIVSMSYSPGLTQNSTRWTSDSPGAQDAASAVRSYSTVAATLAAVVWPARISHQVHDGPTCTAT